MDETKNTPGNINMNIKKCEEKINIKQENKHKNDKINKYTEHI